jgi:DTW domain-containing protein YfiP
MVEDCARCQKPSDLCVCEALPTLATKLHVLILQHPQEPDKLLGSARLSHLALPNSTLKVGLSWPNLSKALGRQVENQKWAVLHLGSGVKGAGAREGIQFVSKKGEPVEAPGELEGIVVLDGTWSQAKTLWWRNAWLLKLRRAVLIPSRKSLYKELRREPRRECLSTIESVAEALVALGEPAQVGDGLRELFGKLLDRFRQQKKNG